MLLFKERDIQGIFPQVVRGNGPFTYIQNQRIGLDLEKKGMHFLYTFYSEQPHRMSASNPDKLFPYVQKVSSTRLATGLGHRCRRLLFACENHALNVNFPVLELFP